MKKNKFKILICGIAMFLSLSVLSHGATKPPPDLAYIKALSNQDMIIGEYIIYMPKLTQDIYDAALLTVSDDQKIYYKSEFAGSTWFQIDDATEMLDIQLTGNTETISEEEISRMYFMIQAPQNGDELIYFMDSGVAKSRFDIKTEALQEGIDAMNAALEEIKKTSASEDTSDSLEGMVAEVDYSSAKLEALNKSVGRGEETIEEKLQLLTNDEIALMNAEIEVLKALAEDAAMKGFNNLADSANLEVMAKLTLKMEDAMAKADDPAYIAQKAVMEGQIAILADQIGSIAAGQDQTEAITTLEGLMGLVKDAIGIIVTKVDLYGDINALGLQQSIMDLQLSGNLQKTDVVSALLDSLNSILENGASSDGDGIFGGTDQGLTETILLNSLEFNLGKILEIKNEKIIEKINLLSDSKSKFDMSLNNVGELSSIDLLRDFGLINPAISKKIKGLSAELGLTDGELPTISEITSILSPDEYQILMTVLNEQANKISKLLDANISLYQQTLLNQSKITDTSNYLDNLLVNVRSICDLEVGSANKSILYDYIDVNTGLLSHSEDMATDLERLLVYISEYNQDYNQSIYDEILSLMKERYYYLYDYEMEKQNNVAISLGVLNEKVREYDLNINKKRAYNFIDTYKLDLEYDIWVATQENRIRTKQLKQIELATYLKKLDEIEKFELDLYEKIRVYYSTGLYSNLPNQNIVLKIEKIKEMKWLIKNMY